MAPRLIMSALALLGAAAFGAASTVAATDSSWILAAAGRSGWLIPAVLALAALVWLTLAMFLSNARPIGVGLALLGATWLVADPASATWRSLAPIAGGWLLLTGELAYWSLDFKRAGVDSIGVHVRRSLTIAALVLGSTALAILPQLNLSQTPVTGIELTAAGLLSAATVVGVVAALAQRLRPNSSSAAAPPGQLAPGDRV